MDKKVTCSITLFAVLFPMMLLADDAPMPKINVVLFTPSDIRRPDGVEERLTQVADYTETFFVTWMKHWGYPPQRAAIFERTADRKVQVLYLEGKDTLSSGKYREATFAPEVWNTALPKYNLGRHRHVWWVWVYLGDPPERFTEFRGFGDVAKGGTAFANFSSLPGNIKVDDLLGNPFLAGIELKGCIHEFGHAFGLPHEGPVLRDNLGMPLMGANILSFRRRTGTQEKRAYLSKASSAMLWKHPVFSGTAKRRDEMPTCHVASLTLDNGRHGEVIHVEGQLQSSIPAHSVVVLDSVPNEQEDYWQKSYAARIDEKGHFDVTITEPTHSPGTLRILFCFDNGVITGDGQNHGIDGALVKRYLATPNGYGLVE